MVDFIEGGVVVRRHVLSENASREQQMDKRERDITNKKRRKNKSRTEYVLEAQSHTLLAIPIEGGGSDVLHHCQMMVSRPQVLS